MRTLPLVVLLVAPLVVSAGTARAGERGWAWPVRGPVAERFALSAADPYARGQHRGIDIAARAGAAVRAACAGRVRFAGAAGGFGRAVTVTCGPYAVTYGHLEAIATAAGERVDRGDRIGRVGKTGRGSTPGPHLHLGVRRAADPNGYVDPLALLPTTRPPSPPPTAPARRAPPPPAPRPNPVPAGETRRRPVPAGEHRPVPAARPIPAGETRPVPAARPIPTPSPAAFPAPAQARMPKTVWLGLGLLAAGVPGLALWRVGARARRGRMCEAHRVAIHNPLR